MAVYESEDNQKAEISSSREVCKSPPRGFRIQFEIKEQYDKGFQVIASIDGILCLTKTDAIDCFQKRLNQLWSQWEEMKTKL